MGAFVRSDESKSVDDLVEEISGALAELPRQPRVLVREFVADSAGEARSAAARWLDDFTAHGPLDIQNIRTSEHQSRFVTVVAYWEL